MWQPVAATTAAVPPSSPRSRPVTLRHEQGRSHLASLLNHWLRNGELSHEQLSRIADWGLGEAGWLSPSQISHLRNRNMARGANAKNIEGLTGANHAIWLWQSAGPEQAIKALGPHSTWQVDAEWLDRAIWLPEPGSTTEPLSYGDFAEVNAGRLKLSYLDGQSLSPGEATDISQRLSDLLNSLAAGGTPAEGFARILDAYPLEDQARRERLRDLLLGSIWSREELEAELYALAVTVATLRGKELSSYGPAELHAELSAHRRRT